jgi:[acyl-carrier-protein] S-malonyltransferase
MIVLLCSGQGSQHSEMFRLTENAPEASGVFAAAAEILGDDPRDIVRCGPASLLQVNLTAQILCVTQALAAYTLLSAVAIDEVIVMGYSVGEVAALGISGLLDHCGTLELARMRARIMDEASSPEDGLAVVRGLRYEQVRTLARATDVEIAIINPGATIIVGGAGPQLQRFCDAARAAGAARSQRLPIAVASHTSRMTRAAEIFHAALPAAPRRSVHGGVRLLSGMDGSLIPDSAVAANLLARQLCTPLHWGECLQAAVDRGGRAFLELGPGHALRDMVRLLWADVPARATEDFAAVDGLRSWVRGRIGS